MAPVYADQPFGLLHTPTSKLPKDTEPDLFHNLASDMVIVHNTLIRGLNSIILQTPYIKPEDEIAFCHYIVHWADFLDMHHRGEEDFFFPGLEKLSGDSGIMDTNVQQHDKFHAKLDDFSDYIKRCIAGTAKFDRNEILRRLNSFSHDLVAHLNDEIPTMLGLSKYGVERMQPIMEIIDKEVQANMGTMTLTGGVSWFLCSLDTEFEGGRWRNFPPGAITRVMFFICRYFFFWVHADWWKFAPCDKHGRLKPLYAVPKEHSD
ncbi:hypothetical protein jhhlp_004865 [Lomentospora prolificans]|uniref:Hemerythrin-like domain-containing protein n=1 Tax=Lomentospora prolificans TaxID=41688 RepID=A0A2N3N7Y6_9PEZI|nr:hypothetical protein jhhlp_004865 [Lomentospora prolificans]